MTPLIQQNVEEAEETVAGEENALIGDGGGENVENSAAVVSEAEEIAETQDTPEQMLSKANEFMSEGKRHIVCRNFQDAATAFDSACEYFSKRYDELSLECAEPYYCYGKSLIELERVNQSIITLTNPNKGPSDKPEKSDDENEPAEKGDEKPDNPDVENETVNKGGEKPEKTDDESTLADKGDEKPKKSENDSEPVNKVDEKSDKSDNESESDDEAEDEEDEEEAELKEGDEAADEEEKKTVLAWQFLDLARIIYEKALDETEDEHERKRMLLRLSEIRVCLGEVCVLDEKYDDAVCEFESAQKIVNDHFPEEDRRLAETYFQIGSASEYDGKFDVAKDNFKKAMQTLESRLKKLEILTASSQKSQASSDNDVTISRDEGAVSRDEGAVSRDEGAVSRDEVELSRDVVSRGDVSSTTSSHETLTSHETTTTTTLYDGEIGELQRLVADIRQRLNDVIESEMEREKTMESLAELIRKTETTPMNGQCTSASAAAEAGEPVNIPLEADDVSHLVRKPIKRDSDGGVKHESEPKRVKIDLTNGKSPNAAATATTNDSNDHVTVKSIVAPSTVENDELATDADAEMVAPSSVENGAAGGDQSVLPPPVEPINQ